MSIHNHQQHENESMWISSRFQNRGSSSDKLVVRIDCAPTRSEQAANWCREPNVEVGELMSTTNETFWAGNLKETPLCGVAPQQHRMNTPALVLQHHKNHFHSLIHIKRNCYKKLAYCLRTNGMKGRNGERKIDYKKKLERMGDGEEQKGRSNMIVLKDKKRTPKTV